MISAGDFRNGITLEIDGQRIPDHGIPARKTGKGSCFRSYQN